MSGTKQKDYSDIIDLPHYVSLKHPHMTRQNRAAQFAPFAALTGHDEAIEETGRLTGKRIELDENQKSILDAKLQMIGHEQNEKVPAKITYFIPDEKKEGGKYVTVTGNIKRIHEYKRLIILQDGNQIPIDDIIEIESDVFDTPPCLKEGDS